MTELVQEKETDSEKAIDKRRLRDAKKYRRRQTDRLKGQHINRNRQIQTKETSRTEFGQQMRFGNLPVYNLEQKKRRIAFS